jgi:hypothetical protein
MFMVLEIVHKNEEGATKGMEREDKVKVKRQ